MIDFISQTFKMLSLQKSTFESLSTPTRSMTSQNGSLSPRDRQTRTGVLVLNGDVIDCHSTIVGDGDDCATIVAALFSGIINYSYISIITVER